MKTDSCYVFDPNTPHCQWWLAITSPQVSYNRQCLAYDVPQMRVDGIEPDMWIREVGESWNFNNRKELHQTIYSLAIAQTHGHRWQSEFARRACCTPQEWERRIQSVANPITQGEMRYLDTVYRHVGTAGFRGWDYCRGSFLARAGYYAGWVTEAELAFLLNFLATQVQYYFNGWQQYLQSFIYGRNYWQYLIDDDPDEVNIPYLLGDGFNLGISKFFVQIENDPECPIFSLPWHTALPELAVPESLQQLLSDSEENDAS